MIIHEFFFHWRSTSTPPAPHEPHKNIRRKKSLTPTTALPTMARCNPLKMGKVWVAMIEGSSPLLRWQVRESPWRFSFVVFFHSCVGVSTYRPTIHAPSSTYYETSICVAVTNSNRRAPPPPMLATVGIRTSAEIPVVVHLVARWQPHWWEMSCLTLQFSNQRRRLRS